MVLKKISVKVCGKLTENYLDKFESIKKPLEKSNLKYLFRVYVNIIVFLTLFSFIISFSFFLFLFVFIFRYLFVWGLIGSLLGSGTVSSLVFFLVYSYPINQSRKRKNSINTNLPFAVNHMSAIASSGVPPYVIFKLLTGFKEYGEVSEEATRIVRNVDTFGQDITSSIEQIAKETPSKKFEELLRGIISTVETGGNLQEYLRVQAKQALFDYRLKREEYMESLSTYADFYTAVLIAAPLFLIALLAIMNMIGRQFAGMNIQDLMTLGIYLIIPAMNSIFIAFVHLTSPGEV